MDERSRFEHDARSQDIPRIESTPETDIPEDRPQEQYRVYDYDTEKPTPRSKVERWLKGGRVIHCSEYYGIPYIWRISEKKYRGILLQYRDVTEDHTFSSAKECIDWFIETSERCAG